MWFVGDWHVTVLQQTIIASVRKCNNGLAITSLILFKNWVGGIVCLIQLCRNAI